MTNLEIPGLAGAAREDVEELLVLELLPRPLVYTGVVNAEGKGELQKGKAGPEEGELDVTIMEGQG